MSHGSVRASVRATIVMTSVAQEPENRYSSVREMRVLASTASGCGAATGRSFGRKSPCSGKSVKRPKPSRPPYMIARKPLASPMTGTRLLKSVILR